MIRTRFAPSPTGYLHIGNIRIALICYLYSKSDHGELMIRIDDTDTNRSNDKYVESIYENLKWLGIEWDIQVKQSERIEKYRKTVEDLRKRNLVYPCYETEHELIIKRRKQFKLKQIPLYDREGLGLSQEDRDIYVQQGRKPHWRFKINYNEPVTWEDKIKGRITFDPRKLSDPVVIREDGTPTYIMSSVIDDVDYQITDIIRGEDHVNSTALQIQMFHALNYMPNFAHLSFLKVQDNKISKTKGGYDIESFKKEGILPMAINSYMFAVGSNKNIVAYKKMSDIAKQFSIESYGKSTVQLTQSALLEINQNLIHNTQYNEMQDYLTRYYPQIDQNSWDALHKNAATLNHIISWQETMQKDFIPIITDEPLLKIASKLLQETNTSHKTIDAEYVKLWINKIKEATGKNGKELFMPIRMALTGKNAGPEIDKILNLIGINEAKRRLEYNTQS